MSLWIRSRSERLAPKPTRVPIKTRVFATVFLASVLSSVQAATLWVAPANLDSRATVGPWAVTDSGQATFSFALPDDVAEMLSAKLVLLPSADAEIAYQIRLALTREGFGGDDYTDVQAAENVTLVGAEVVEIDISGLIPPVEMLLPGRDYLTVGFVARNADDAEITTAANVLGLRLEYQAGIPGMGPDGEFSSTGVGDTQASEQGEVSRITTRESDGSLPSTGAASSASAITQSTKIASSTQVAETRSNTGTTSRAARSKTTKALSNVQFRTTGNASIGGDLEVLGRFQSDDSENTAVGTNSLGAVTTGRENTAVGEDTLGSNDSGVKNTAVGKDALDSNVSGNDNTAVGTNALQNNTSGIRNTAVGSDALGNSTGNDNTAVGRDALRFNETGRKNTAVGRSALVGHSTGSNNIALGENAGAELESGNDNIYIGNFGPGISGAEAGTTRIGTTGTQTSTFVAGIRGVTTGVDDATMVMIDSNGQLGTVSSSRRYKEQIRNMGQSSEGLLALRPVTYRYKEDVQAGNRRTEFGLIAEEVAEVYPALVAYDDGQPTTVRYHVLISMLLNELQRDHRRIGEQEQLIGQLSARLARLEGQSGN